MQFHGGNPATLGDKEPVEVRTTRVSYNFVTALGVQPAMGRNFEPQEELPNAPKTALLTDALWRNQFRLAARYRGAEHCARRRGLPGDRRVAAVVRHADGGADGHFDAAAGLAHDKPSRPWYGDVDGDRAIEARCDAGAGAGEPEDAICGEQGRRARNLSRRCFRNDRAPAAAHGGQCAHAGSGAGGRGGVSADDCLRQRGEPAAGALERAVARAGGARGHRRRAGPAGAPASDGDGGVVRGGVRRGNRADGGRSAEPSCTLRRAHCRA